MKVAEPKFGSISGLLLCEDCPFTDEDGYLKVEFCGENHCNCPTDAATYQAACELAEGGGGDEERYQINPQLFG